MFSVSEIQGEALADQPRPILQLRPSLLIIITFRWHILTCHVEFMCSGIGKRRERECVGDVSGYVGTQGVQVARTRMRR